jgi:hypothetical protein
MKASPLVTTHQGKKEKKKIRGKGGKRERFYFILF